MHGRTKLAVLAVAVALALGGSGCFYYSRQEVRTEGRKLTPEMLGRVEPGETTREDLVRMFGPPDRVSQPEPGREVLTYAYERRTQADRAIFLLMRSEKRLTEVKEYKFALEDGTVVRTWCEQSP